MTGDTEKMDDVPATQPRKSGVKRDKERWKDDRKSSLSAWFSQSVQVVEESVSQSVSQPVSRSVGQPVGQPVGQSVLPGSSWLWSSVRRRAPTLVPW